MNKKQEETLELIIDPIEILKTRLDILIEKLTKGGNLPNQIDYKTADRK